MANKTEIEIDGKNKGAVVAINGVKQELTGLSKAVDGPFASSMGRLSGMLTLGAATAGITALGALAKSAINTADELYKMSQKVGVSVESLSTLKYAAELSDISMDQLETGIKKLSSGMYDLSKGVGQTVTFAFNDLGVNVLDSNGKLRATEDVLLEVADKFAIMSDGTEKSALAVKLFGRAGLDMIPFLNQGAAGIKSLTDEAEKLGLKISTETGQAAEKFNDTLTTFKNTLAGLVNEALPPLLEDLNNFTQGVIDLNAAVQDFSGQSLVQGISRSIRNFSTMGIDVKELTGIVDLIKRFKQQQKELKQHTDEVNKSFIATIGIGNKIYPALIDNTNKENDALNNQLNKVKQLKDEYAKLVETKAKGQPQLTAVGAQSNLPQFNEIDFGNGGFEMFPVDVNPFDPLANYAIDFFDMYDERASLMRAQTANVFGNMANAAQMFYQTGGQRAKSMFAIYKALSIGQAVISTYNAAAAALAPPPIGAGPLFGPILAASTIALGLAQVASIAGASMGGSGGGGARGGSGAGTSNFNQNLDRGAGDFNPGQAVSYNIIVNGNIYDGDKFAREIVPYINKAVADGVS